ncbi:CatA-like O-acetyltransferase [Yoonia sediminilitoris]|uniref:Chloramphenicol O-acetyltransferase type A n=1 Tax=Yoonia sediminilitoris TaxID=1286148 RepID=A0A2T6KJW9_9RHOB|nr:CatA-like O-acetyltransferase [Yoonia sediminilitoris]PUB16209.1 chloramphenicol O-acetyltransferase type A [Yoonia sediminilitoris]RCW96558.1 chloramphenicol O-acetyltransferase type A [Yoonia sediminilitoris]
MTYRTVDLATWPRAAQFQLFRSYQKPHYAITSRLDVSNIIARKAGGLSAYRACLFAIGAGIHAVPELCMRFRGDQVVRHDMISLSMTVPKAAGSFGYAYVPFVADFAAFDAQAARLITAVAAGRSLAPNTGERDDLAYLSCMPWLDYSSINNALPGPEDCIPRVTWGKFVQNGDGWDMAMTLEVHHALVDGAQVGAYFGAVQDALHKL